MFRCDFTPRPRPTEPTCSAVVTVRGAAVARSVRGGEVAGSIPAAQTRNTAKTVGVEAGIPTGMIAGDRANDKRNAEIHI